MKSIKLIQQFQITSSIFRLLKKVQKKKNDTKYEELIKLLFKSIDNKITFSSEEWKAVGQVLFLLGEEGIKDDCSMRTLEESLSHRRLLMKQL
ncbi:hypothetical protein M9Y10_030406 [Tritrichomonas musculus]|uniref:Uncharacterized protein n=1 Tax=Tritrichomonas musculus TaxID=1915356 RepID=A0ABR2H411_9EUKA